MSDAAQDVIQYISLWLRKHDPEFQEQLVGKSLTQVIVLANQRYGASMDSENPSAADLLYEFANAIQAYKEAAKISVRRRNHEKRVSEASALKAAGGNDGRSEAEESDVAGDGEDSQ